MLISDTKNCVKTHSHFHSRPLVNGAIMVIALASITLFTNAWLGTQGSGPFRAEYTSKTITLIALYSSALLFTSVLAYSAFHYKQFSKHYPLIFIALVSAIVFAECLLARANIRPFDKFPPDKIDLALKISLGMTSLAIVLNFLYYQIGKSQKNDTLPPSRRPPNRSFRHIPSSISSLSAPVGNVLPKPKKKEVVLSSSIVQPPAPSSSPAAPPGASPTPPPVAIALNIAPPSKDAVWLQKLRDAMTADDEAAFRLVWPSESFHTAEFSWEDIQMLTYFLETYKIAPPTFCVTPALLRLVRYLHNIKDPQLRKQHYDIFKAYATYLDAGSIFSNPFGSMSISRLLADMDKEYDEFKELLFQEIIYQKEASLDYKSCIQGAIYKIENIDYIKCMRKAKRLGKEKGIPYTDCMSEAIHWEIDQESNKRIFMHILINEGTQEGIPRGLISTAMKTADLNTSWMEQYDANTTRVPRPGCEIDDFEPEYSLHLYPEIIQLHMNIIHSIRYTKEVFVANLVIHFLPVLVPTIIEYLNFDLKLSDEARAEYCAALQKEIDFVSAQGHLLHRNQSFIEKMKEKLALIQNFSS